MTDSVKKQTVLGSDKYLSRFQLNGLIRLGDLYIPGTDLLPSFSRSECFCHLDIVLAQLDPDDVRAVRWLLVFSRFLPKWVLRRLLGLMDRHDRFWEWIAAPLRLLNLALKGLITSLYYSGLPSQNSHSPNVLALMGFELICEPDSEVTS